MFLGGMQQFFNTVWMGFEFKMVTLLIPVPDNTNCTVTITTNTLINCLQIQETLYYLILITHMKTNA